VNDYRDPGDHHAEERRRDQEIVAHTRNTARYFTENRHIAWVALIATFAWGIYGYGRMAKSKDPVVEVRIAAAACIWPGAEAEKVEQLVTRKIEQKLAENASVEKIESISRTGVSIVYVVLKESVVDRAKEWDNIQGRLDSIHNLPQGAGPIQFQRDFGDTTTLMLTVASPKVNDIELQLRAAAVAQAITAVRAGARSGPGESRATIVISFPSDINSDLVRRVSERLARQLDAQPGTGDARLIDNPGFVGIDVATTLDDTALLARFAELTETQLQASDLHPDVWSPAVVRDPKDAQARLTAVAGDRYSHRQLDQVTEQIQRSLQRVPSVATVARIGVLPEQIHLEYSQERLASFGLPPSALGAAIATRNITAPGGVLDVAGKNVPIAPTGEFSNEQQIRRIIFNDQNQRLREGIPRFKLLSPAL